MTTPKTTTAKRSDLPPPRPGSGRRHLYEGDYESLEPGESFSLPFEDQNAARSFLTIRAKKGEDTKRFQTAKEIDPEGKEWLRVWRVDGLPGVGESPERQPKTLLKVL